MTYMVTNILNHISHISAYTFLILLLRIFFHRFGFTHQNTDFVESIQRQHHDDERKRIGGGGNKGRQNHQNDQRVRTNRFQ